MNTNRITLVFFFVVFGMKAVTPVSFSKENIDLQVKRVEKVMNQLVTRRKFATGGGIIGALLLVNYYKPGLLTSLFPIKSVTYTPQVVLPFDQSFSLGDKYLKLFEMIQDHEGRLNVLSSIYQQNNPNNENNWIPYKFLAFVKNSIPLILASSLYPVLDRYINYIRATCFPQVNLNWFVGMHSRYPHFMMILEEQAKLVSFEKDKKKHDLIIVQIHDAFEAVVDHCGGIIGYMAYQQQKSVVSNNELSRAMMNIVNYSIEELSSFCKDMNELFIQQRFIEIPGRIESFKDAFDSNRRNFIVYELEVQDPSMHENLV